MVVLPDKTDYGSFTEPASSGIFVSSGVGGFATTPTTSTVTSPTPVGVPPPYFIIAKEGSSPPRKSTGSVSSLQSQQGSGGGTGGGIGKNLSNVGTACGSLASVLQNNNNINSSYSSLTSNISHRSVGSGNSTSETTRPRNLSQRGSLPAVVPVRAFVTTIETASGKAFTPISCLCENESQLHKTPPGLLQTEDLDSTKIYSSTSSPMSSSSSGDFHQRQPLLQESKNNGGWDDDTRIEEIHTKDTIRNGSVIRINIPVRTESEESLLKRFPEERVKTLVAFLWLCFNFMLATVSLALTHERLPDPKTASPLPDIVLDNIRVQDWALTVSEILLSCSTFFTFFLILVHKHRWIVFRRTFFILGVLYLMRSITMFVTVLPVASRSYGLTVCAPKANTTSVLLITRRALQLMSGFGLSMNGQHVYCGDYMYSGHTVVLVIAYLLIKEYSSRRCVILHWTSFIVSLVGVVMILISRGHYTVDVLVAYYVTTRLFWMYHTVANNLILKNYSTTNFLSNVWWFPIFKYLEGNVAGPVPRHYNCPSPCLTKLYRRLSLRRSGRAEYP